MNYYDLYLSIGPVCRPAYHLMINDLRNEAYPLDWQMEYSLDTIIHLFQTKFNDFFTDIEESNPDWNGTHRKIKDTKNNIISIHHFSKDIELPKAHEEFLQKMSLRFQKLDEKLKKANKIVLIGNRNDTVKELQNFITEFSCLYPHLEIKLINIRNNRELSIDSYSKNHYVVNENLSIEEYCINDAFNITTQNRADWRGNVAMWGKILEKYHSKYFNQKIVDKIKSTSHHLVIFGAGQRCWDLVYKFNKYNITIKGIAVTDSTNNPEFIGRYAVKPISEYDKNDFIVISLADRKEAEIVRNTLVSNGYRDLSFVDSTLAIETFSKPT